MGVCTAFSPGTSNSGRPKRYGVRMRRRARLRASGLVPPPVGSLPADDVQEKAGQDNHLVPEPPDATLPVRTPGQSGWTAPADSWPVPRPEVSGCPPWGPPLGSVSTGAPWGPAPEPPDLASGQADLSSEAECIGLVAPSAAPAGLPAGCLRPLVAHRARSGSMRCGRRRCLGGHRRAAAGRSSHAPVAVDGPGNAGQL
jgi:hypothetical protein